MNYSELITLGVEEAEIEKKDHNTFNYMNAKLTEIIYTTYLKSHEIFWAYYIRRYYIWRCTQRQM